MAEILKNNSFMALPSSIKRGNPAPLDVTEIWFSYAEMENYAKTNATAYVGQQMALVDENEKTAKAYIILNTDGDLQEIGSGVLTDNLSIAIDDEGALGLHDYGVKYYKYVAASGDVAAHYEPQEVNDENPWKAGLEPRVVLEGEDLVLGWYEPNPTTIEGVQDQVTDIQSNITILGNTVDALGETIENLTETVNNKANADDVYSKDEIDFSIESLNNQIDNKANIADVYTKTEVDNYLATKADANKVYTIEQTDNAIAAAVASADHLKRKTVASIEEIEAYIAANDDATQYIFMVPTETQQDSNKYYEYMVFEIAGENDEIAYSIEKVGAWEVDLNDYATKDELNSLQTSTSNSLTALSEDITEEINRAKAAEKANADAIKAEEDRAVIAEEALGERIDNLDYINSTEFSNTLNEYATKTDLSNGLAEKADKGTSLADYGITNAYTKEETLDKIEEKITEINDGESAGEVLSQLNSYKEITDEKINNINTNITNIENELNGLDIGDKNVINSVEESEFNLIDTHLSLKGMSASKLIGLESHSAITNLEALLNQKVSQETYNEKMTSIDNELTAIKDIITWKEL